MPKYNSQITPDLFANIKLLCFVDITNIKNFYNEIKYKYRVKFPKFFKYFDKFYLSSKPFCDLDWNYNTSILNNENNDILFFTNNICESANLILNSKFIVACKTLFHFQKAITEVIKLYNNKKVYKEKKLSTSRALEYYIKRNEIITLITVKELNKIKIIYKDYLKSNKFSFGNYNFESYEDENYEKKKIRFY